MVPGAQIDTSSDYRQRPCGGLTFAQSLLKKLFSAAPPVQPWRRGLCPSPCLQETS